jgi:hypothetical protein
MAENLSKLGRGGVVGGGERRDVVRWRLRSWGRCSEWAILGSCNVAGEGVGERSKARRCWFRRVRGLKGRFRSGLNVDMLCCARGGILICGCEDAKNFSYRFVDWDGIAAGGTGVWAGCGGGRASDAAGDGEV